MKYTIQGETLPVVICELEEGFSRHVRKLPNGYSDRSRTEK